MDKLCPMKMAGQSFASGNFSYRDMDCSEEKCAWWNKDCEACSMVMLTNCLQIMGGKQ